MMSPAQSRVEEGSSFARHYLLLRTWCKAAFSVPLHWYYALGVIWTNNAQGVKRVREGDFSPQPRMKSDGWEHGGFRMVVHRTMMTFRSGFLDDSQGVISGRARRMPTEPDDVRPRL